jgi:hypothetical protein
MLTLTAICTHSALVVRSDAAWRRSRISPKHSTYQSRLPNRYFDAVRDVDESNLDRKSGHGGRPIDATCRPPKKALSLPAAQHNLRICSDDVYTCAAISPVKAGKIILLQLFWSTAIGMQRSTSLNRVIELSTIVGQCCNKYDLAIFSITPFRTVCTSSA